MTWPMTDRDTTEFPTISIDATINFREHLKGILSIPNGTETSDYEKVRKTAFSGVSDQRIRTYRKLYERLGLIYPLEGQTFHSNLGVSISSLEERVESIIKFEIKEISKMVVSVLKKYQFVNPMDTKPNLYPGLPKVHPYFLLWKAMEGLDGKIHYHEINRVLLKVETDSEIDVAISKILAARTKFTAGYKEVKVLDVELGTPVVSDQVSARIAPLYSLAGWGGLLIEREPDSEGFRHFNRDTRQVILDTLENDPEFFKTDSKEEWISYYFSEVSDDKEDPELKSANNIILCQSEELDLVEISKRIRELGGDFEATIVEQLHLGLTFLPEKHFVLLKGPSGTGKTLLVRAYARALFGVKNLQTPLSNLFLCPVRPNWTDPNQVLGYFDVIANHFVVPTVLEAVLAAIHNPDYPVYLCLDEMNLARIEYYFSDVLSAMESREEFELHSRGKNILCAKGRVIPEKIQLPSNLYIVGTINVDESTLPISDKVLDRATIVDLPSGSTSMYLDFLAKKKPELLGLIDRLGDLLTSIDAILIEVNQSINKRSLEEILLYLLRVESSTQSNFTQHLDGVIKSKVLVKLSGDESDRAAIEILDALLRVSFEGSELSSCYQVTDNL